LRLCVVVTLCVGLLVAVEIYSYLRYTSAAGDVMELAVKLELAQNESPPNTNTGRNSRRPTRSRITRGSSGAVSLTRAS